MSERAEQRQRKRTFEKERGFTCAPDSCIAAMLGDANRFAHPWMDHPAAFRDSNGQLVVVCMPHADGDMDDTARTIRAADEYAAARGLVLSLSGSGYHARGTIALEFSKETPSE